MDLIDVIVDNGKSTPLLLAAAIADIPIVVTPCQGCIGKTLDVLSVRHIFLKKKNDWEINKNIYFVVYCLVSS